MLEKVGSVICLLLVISNPCFSQKYPDQVNRFEYIARLINEDRMIELSLAVNYPIHRPNPIPDIENAHAFIFYYPVLFDSVFKERISGFEPTSVSQHHGNYGILNGDLWLDESGQIVAINYSSAQELQLKEMLDRESQMQTFPQLKPWKNNVILCKNDKYVIRVDETEDGLRYSSWSLNRSLSDKPDLVITNGIQDFRGTQGGVTYSFTNDRWKYIVDNVEVCADTQDCGLFLEVKHNDSLRLKLACAEIKYPVQTQVFGHIIDLIKEDRIVALSSMVRYPLMGNSDPMPRIENRNEFILSYPLTVDSVFKKQSAKYDWDKVYHKYGYNLGDLWIDEDDTLNSITYGSDQNSTQYLALVNEIRNGIYPELLGWEDYQMTLQTDDLVIRIDWMGKEKGYRYVAWPRERSISEEPDLVIYNGTAEYHGNMGSRTFFFKNGQYMYVIDYWVHEEFPTLTVLYNEVEKAKIKCKRITQSDCKIDADKVKR